MSGRGRGPHSDARSNPWHGGGRGRGRGTSGAVASTPTQTPAYFPPPSVSASSSSAPVTSLSSEMEQKLTLDATPVAVVASESKPGPPPASSKAVRFQQRPGFGTIGRKIQVKANHFLVQVSDRDLHHYDVVITPEVASKKIHRDVINQLVHLYSETHLGKRMPAYDGMKSLYTAGPLPFSSKEFVVKLVENDGRAAGPSTSKSRKKDREFKVALTLANKPDLYQLQQFLRSQHVETPQEAIQVLDVVLRATPSEEYTVVGRSFFSTKLGPKGSLGEGLEYWRGFYQSLRPTQLGLSLNIDVSARSFYEPILVTEFLAKHFSYTDRSKPLPDRDCIKVKKALKRVKVEVSLRDWTKNEEVKRTYTINGLSAQPLAQLRFTCEDEITSVAQYYRKKYKIDLKYVAWPAIQAGNDSKPVYLPMELCSIVAGQRYTKKLNRKQVSNLLRATCQRPSDRESNIKQMVRRKTDNRESLIRREFGLQVREEMTLVKARVLPSPLLKYHDSGREKSVYPQMGQWNMTNKKMVNGGKLEFWVFVNFSSLYQESCVKFCEDLVNVCNSKGMDFFRNPLLPLESYHPGQIERVLRDIHKLTFKKGRQLQLLIVILPNSSDSSYGTIKRICETELGIVSQCCDPQKVEFFNRQYLENLALKINVKVGGRNTVLNDAIQRKIPVVTDQLPTIIFGADVTHPAPGDDSSSSIAAVVASTDWPEVTNYRAIVSAQPHHDEIIKDLYKSHNSEKGLVHGGMIRELLIAFYRQKRLKPSRIIFYRDGVSEGQFSQVLLYEMDAIRKACGSLEEGYMPKVTFVVVQKRHHTRLFPADHNNRDQKDKSGNILPGTVVDTEICHPTEFDFYLNSHAGIQGTSRPAHYHVLFDENRFTADGLQVLTNNLCYTYVRCTRSVSIVPPAYYAHLVAFRARHYIEGESSDGGSTSGGGEQVLRALPEIKENVKEVMFYC